MADIRIIKTISAHFVLSSNLNIFLTPHQKVMCRLCRLKDFFEMSCHISEQIKQLKTVALV